MTFAFTLFKSSSSLLFSSLLFSSLLFSSLLFSSLLFSSLLFSSLLFSLFCFLNYDSLDFSVSGPRQNSAFIPEVQICTAPVASPVHMTFITFVCYHTLLDVLMCSIGVVLVPRCVSSNHKHCSNHMLLFSNQNGHTPFIQSQQWFTNTYEHTLTHKRSHWCGCKHINRDLWRQAFKSC